MGDSRRVLLVRHPQTVANVHGVHVARGDSPYSPLGSDQARLLPAAIAAWAPDAIVASPQRRALQPARRGARDAGVGLRVDPGLREYHVGEAEGLSHDEAVKRGVVNGYDLSDAGHRPFEGGESVGEFAVRCQAAWERLLDEQGERLCAVTHRGVIRFLVVHALDLPIDSLWKLNVEPAQGVQVVLSDGYAVLESLGRLPAIGDDGTMQLDPRGDAEGA